jgi:hypothetical protein
VAAVEAFLSVSFETSAAASTFLMSPASSPALPSFPPMPPSCSASRTTVLASASPPCSVATVLSYSSFSVVSAAVCAAFASRAAFSSGL